LNLILPSLTSINLYLKGGGFMQKYRCSICGYIYDPEEGDIGNGIQPGTAFEALPDDWVCPMCGVEKSFFEPA